ncbi:DinI-like family protein, partial [Escherichia coli]
MRIEVTIAKTSPLPAGAIDALAGELSRRIQYAFPDNEGHVLMNPLMILVKIIKLRWIHILSYDQMVSRKINNQTTRCANS